MLDSIVVTMLIGSLSPIEHNKHSLIIVINIEINHFILDLVEVS